MPLYKTITFSEGLIGIWQITESITELIPGFTKLELESSDYLQYNYDKRKIEWLATRKLMKELIGSDFKITYLESGKPILNHHKFKHISISHSREFVGIFVHERLHTGIDIESISRNYKPVEKRYLSDEELIHVNGNPLLQCLYWCVKEAVFKLVPEDGVEFRQQIHVSPFDPDIDEQIEVCYLSESKERHLILQFLIFEGHGMAWIAN